MRGRLWMVTTGLALLALGAGGRCGEGPDAPADRLLGTWISDDYLSGQEEEADEFDEFALDEPVSWLRFEAQGPWWIFERDEVGGDCRHVSLPWAASGDSLWQPGHPDRRYAWSLSPDQELVLTGRDGRSRSFLPAPDAPDTSECPATA